MGRRPMQGFWKDLAFGLRVQLRTPVATAAVVATLAIAMAATGVAFSLLNSFFIRPLPVADPARLVRVYTSLPGGPQHFTVSYPDFADLRRLTTVFSGMAVEEPVPLSVDAALVRGRVWGQRVSEGYFALLGLRPARGRFFGPDEHAASGGQRVAVLGYDLWRRGFGGTGDALGQPLHLNGQPYTVVGVAPRAFHGTTLGVSSEVWLPVGLDEEAPDRRGARGYFALGRLQPGVAIEEAGAALDVLARRLEAAHPASNRGVRFAALPESEGRVHPLVRGSLLGFSGALFAVAALLLALACANVAAVLLARGLSRRQEIGVRVALGARRGRIVRQLLTEGALLSLVATAAGLLLTWAATRLLGAVPLPAARGARLSFDLGLDARVVGFSLLVSVAAGVAFTLAPALSASRCDLVALIKGGTSSGGRPPRLGAGLVAAQVALSTTLLVGAGLFLRSLQNARRVDLGFAPAGVVMASVDLAARGYGPAERERFWRTLVERMAALPQALSVSLADRVPFEVNITTMSVTPEGRPPPPEGGWPAIDFAVVDERYFETLDIPLLEGRGFREGDPTASPSVVVVNEVMARRFWPRESAVGRRLVSPEGELFEVVGVAKAAKYLTLGETPRPYVYRPLSRSHERTLTIVVRGAGDAEALLGRLGEAVGGLDATAPVYNLTTLARYVRWALLPAASGAAVLNAVALTALGLTSLGLFGTVAHAAGRRTHEIGVRRALGAGGADVVWLVTRPALRLVAGGLVAGSLLGLAGSRLLASVLYGVETADPLVFALPAAVLLLVCLVASALPAWRATRIDAAAALRHD